MQNNVTTPQAQFPWLKTLFGILDYLDEIAIDSAWVKRQVDQNPSHIKPRLRVLTGILAKRTKIKDAESLEVAEGKPFTITEEGNARKFVQTVFRQFLDYTYPELDNKPDTNKIYASNNVVKGKEIFLFTVIFTKPPTIKRGTSQKTESTPSETMDEQYVAYYLYRYQIPLLGFATLTWEKDTKGNPLRLYKAAFLQYADKPTPSERVFETIQSIHRIYKPSSDLSDHFIYYPTFQEVTETPKDPILLQVVIDIHTTKRDIIFGSFASLRQNDVMTPSAGWVLLVKGSEPDYQNSKKLLHNHNALDDTQHKNIINNFWAAQYFLIDKIITINKSSFEKIENLPTFQNWSDLNNIYKGVYMGTFYVDRMENQKEVLVKQQFVLEILPTGFCRIYYENTEELILGFVRVNGKQLSFFFRYNENIGSYLFSFVIYISNNTENSKSIGVYSGKISPSLISKFSSGTITLEKKLDVDALSYAKTLEFQKIIDLTNQSEFLGEYIDFLSPKYDGYTDGLIVRNLLKNNKPVDVEFTSRLKKLKLLYHYKYITFRVPKSERYGLGSEDSFRVEKCDLVFNQDFTSVTVQSKLNKYEGKTYYNNKVLLMILNPASNSNIALDSSQTQVDPQFIPVDSYFVIQIVLPNQSEEPSTFTDFLFGTSMWKGDYNLEAKMVTLVKPYVDQEGIVDSSCENYIIGTHGHPNIAGINEVLKQDENYFGAFSYVIGRSNRNIRASSTHAKTGIYRPRDKYNREPFLFAALYANELAKKSSNKPAERMKYIDRAKRYFFEAYMHQYGASYHAGKKIDDNFYSSEDTVMERIMDIKNEQILLREAMKEIEDTSLCDLLKNLWPYLNE